PVAREPPGRGIRPSGRLRALQGRGGGARLPARLRGAVRPVFLSGGGGAGGRFAAGLGFRVSGFELKMPAGPTRNSKLETRNRWVLLGAAILSGLLFALAFPPLEWVALLPLAPVPWLVALHGEGSRGRALLSGFVFGLAYWCASIPWIVYVVTTFG